MHPVLTMSAREIRRRNRERIPILWGATRTRQRQYGGPLDRKLYRLEEANWKRLLQAQQGVGRALRRAGLTATEAGEALAAAVASGWFGGGRDGSPA